MCYPSVTVALDVSDGSVHLLTGSAARLISELAAVAGTTEATATDDQRAYLIEQLIDRRWLVAIPEPSEWEGVQSADPQSPSWGTRESAAALIPVGPASLKWSLLGVTALAVVLCARHLGPTRTRFARARNLAPGPRKQGTSDRRAAERAARAVRGVGRVLPARIACLEEATATALVLYWSGHRVTWRHGVATDPVRMHAWIEVDGSPVGEADDITDYTPFEEPYE
ncbi:lasso peptide biosynthesis B2 protein [Nocardiopsis sp. NRRL B-16309]|uniref:lasso peptide biosynthesis B2 protein n=1 Tax=Nocardiopsis sp. NRRL B-16309 TaxID=1519494 RepID=UPI0012E302C0